jgi:hypothetical protein
MMIAGVSEIDEGGGVTGRVGCGLRALVVFSPKLDPRPAKTRRIARAVGANLRFRHRNRLIENQPVNDGFRSMSAAGAKSETFCLDGIAILLLRYQVFRQFPIAVKLIVLLMRPGVSENGIVRLIEYEVSVL